MRRARKLALYLAGVASTLCAVAALHSARAVPRDYSPYRKLSVFAKVLTYIENNYVDHVDDTQLIYGAIDGMLQSLDPHSVFMPPDQYRQLKGDTQGEFSGIGIEVEIRDGWITVVSPIEGTPAARAGLKTEDRLVAVDGKSTKDITMHEAVRRMRGAPGSWVELSVKRRGVSKQLTFRLQRAVIEIVSVTSKALSDGIGYVRIKTFQERTDRHVEEALQALEQHGKLKGLVLDLRNNPGGLLHQAVRVADLFLSEGLIVRTRGKAGRILDEEHAHSRGSHTSFPMVCLVNGGSASASEIVAGALQDQRRSVVMGERTFGKGSVQTIVELEDGSALKLTVAKYTTPAERSIQDKGIEPDIVVAAENPPGADPQPDEARSRARRRSTTERQARTQRAAINDFQLATAIKYLHAAEIFRAHAEL